jgi:hypothetical protein
MGSKLLAKILWQILEVHQAVSPIFSSFSDIETISIRKFWEAAWATLWPEKKFFKYGKIPVRNIIRHIIENEMCRFYHAKEMC